MTYKAGMNTVLAGEAFCWNLSLEACIQNTIYAGLSAGMIQIYKSVNMSQVSQHTYKLFELTCQKVQIEN